MQKNSVWICTKIFEAGEKFYLRLITFFAKSWGKISGALLMTTKMHFIQELLFRKKNIQRERKQMTPKIQQKFFWSKRTGKNCQKKKMEIRRYRNWKHWPLHNGSEGWSAMRRCWIKRTADIGKLNTEILWFYFVQRQDGRNHSVRCWHPKVFRFTVHRGQDISQHRKSLPFWIIWESVIIHCRIFHWQVYCILRLWDAQCRSLQSLRVAARTGCFMRAFVHTANWNRRNWQRRKSACRKNCALFRLNWKRCGIYLRIHRCMNWSFMCWKKPGMEIMQGHFREGSSVLQILPCLWRKLWTMRRQATGVCLTLFVISNSYRHIR